MKQQHLEAHSQWGSGWVSLQRFSLSHLERLWVPRLHKKCNSRKRRFPHWEPDIKLLTVAIWRGGMERFHFTVQISAFHSTVTEWRMEMQHSPSSSRYWFIAFNLVDLMAC